MTGTRDDNGGEGDNARQTFTPAQSGTYYISARGAGDGVGTYTLTVTDTTTPEPAQQTVQQAPVFGVSGYAFNLAENADGSTDRVSLGTVAATDPEGATLSYSLVGDSGSFEIDETSGELFYTGSGEDYESGTTSFSLTVRASDGSETTDTTVTVDVTDVNETPAFAGADYTFTLAENADGSTDRVSLGTVAATDPEGATLAYSLVGDSGSFEVDETSGELFYTGSGEDFESGTTQFTLTVRASDGSGTTDTTVTVNVTDVAETVDPPAADGEQSTPQTVSEPDGEDFSADTSTSGKVALGETATGDIGTAGDRDWFAVELVAGRTYTIELRGSPTDDGTLSDPLLYGIHDADGERIANTVDDDGGYGRNSEVTLTAPASGTFYIAAGAYSVNQGSYTVEVTDDTPGTAVNAAPAFGQQGYTFDLAENADGSTNRVSLGTVAATDPEGTTLAYSLAGGNESGSFEIDATSGELFYKGSGEDFESGTTQFTLTVRASDGSESADTTVTVDVTDVDDTPAIRVADAEATEGDDTEMVFRVTLQSASSETVTVNYATADGTATAGEDYTATSGTLTFAPGETEKTVSVTIIDDTVEDSGETFTLALSDPSGGTLGDTEATGTIFNTDPPAVQTSVSEPDGVDLPAGTTTTGKVVVGGTATGNIGTSEDSDWFAVELVAGRRYTIDLRGRPTEDGTLGDPFLCGIHDSGGNLISGTMDDDRGYGRNSRVTFTAAETGTYYIAAGTVGGIYQGTYTLAVTEKAPTIRVANPQATEGDDTEMVFRVTLESASSRAVTVNYATTDGTATAGADYTATSGTLTFAPGETEKSVAVTILDDTLEDSAETFRLVLSNPSGARLGDRKAIGAIFDTETRSSVSEPASHDLRADTTTPGVVTVGGTVTGNIGTRGDRDWFAVELVAGTVYRIDLKGRSTSDGTQRDPYLRGIHDAEGDLLPYTQNDAHGTGSNARVYFTAIESGTFYIAAGADRNYQGTYTLAVTEVGTDDYAGDVSTDGSVAVDGTTDGMIGSTNDRDWFAVQLDADTLYRIELKGGWGGPHLVGIYDSNGSEVAGAVPDIQWRHTPRLFFTPTEEGTYYIAAGTDSFGRHPPRGSYTLSVTEMDDDDDDLSADIMTMGSVAVGGSAKGTVETPYDRDWFAVELIGGTSYRIDLKGYDTGNGTTWNTFLAGIHDSNGDLIPGTTDDDGGFWQEAQVSFTPADTGTYYIAAGAAGTFSGVDTFFHGAFTGSYTLFVEEVM